MQRSSMDSVQSTTKLKWAFIGLVQNWSIQNYMIIVKIQISLSILFVPSLKSLCQNWQIIKLLEPKHVSMPIPPISISSLILTQTIETPFYYQPVLDVTIYFIHLDGFKFSIVMGEIVEEMFETGKPKFKLFELSRFLLPKL